MRTREMDNPILVKTVDVEPFPVEVLPEWISEYVNGLSKELNTMVDLPVSAALSALAAALTGKVFFTHNNWILNVNLYQVLAALPASKKDAIINRVFKELHLIRKETYEKHIELSIKIQSKIDSLSQTYRSIEDKISTTNDPKKIKEYELKLEKLNAEINKNKLEKVMRWSVISGDITPERLVEVLSSNDGMLTIATAEASELFEHANGRYNNRSVDLLLKAWEGSEYTAFRATKEDEIISEPLLNLCLFTQPEVFDSLRRFEHRGLPQRFLMIYPDRYPEENLKYFYTFDNTIEKKFHQNIAKLDKSKLNKPINVKVGKDAIDKFKSLYRKIAIKSYDDQFPEAVQEWNGKIFGNLLKVITLLLIARKIDKHEELEKIDNNIKLTLDDIEIMKKLYTYYSAHFKKSYKLIKTGVKENNLYYFFRRILELYRDYSHNPKLRK